MSLPTVRATGMRLLLLTVACALCFVVAERDVHMEYAKVAKHEQRLTGFSIFHINLGWECAALPPFGSGIYAAVHCKPGKFTNAVEDKIPEWVADSTVAPPLNPKSLPWTANAAPYSTLVSSCQNTFLHKMKRWNDASPYDVVTIVEMAHPGAAGLEEFLDRPVDTLPELAKSQQQVDPRIYQTLRKVVLKDYGVFTHLVANKVVAIQATFFRKASLGELSLGVGFNMLSKAGGERPNSALFFVPKKVLVLNIHSVHFRKTLLAADAAVQFGSAGGKSMQDLRNEWFPNLMLESQSETLQALFGRWVTAKLVESLQLCKVTPNAVLDSVQGYCQVGDESAVDAVLGETDWSTWKIFAAGDFNDETMELSRIPIFGQYLSIDPIKRKRTCCSDRDQHFKRVMKGAHDVADEDRPQNFEGKPVHTKANKKYLEETCKYVPQGELDRWLVLHEALNPMNLEGATQILGDGTVTKSSYPFPSDNIVSNVESQSGIEFPTDYSQKMSAMVRAKEDADGPWSDPVMRGRGYEDGMISDHDPIQRTFDF